MRRRAANAGSKTVIIFTIVLLLRSAAGAQDGVQASNRQQVQQAQQGQNSGDRSDFLLIPALIALAAAQRQYRAQLTATYTPSPATTTTTTTTTISSTASGTQQQLSSSSSGTSKAAVPAGTVLDLSTGAMSATAGSLAGTPAGSSTDPAGTVLDLTTGSKAASSSSSSSQLTVPQGSSKPADPAGTVLDLSTGVKAPPTGTTAATATPSAGTGRSTPTDVPAAPAPAAGAPPAAGTTAMAKPPAYTVSPGAPNDPPGTVLIMVPGTTAAAGPPSSSVSEVTPGSSSSSSSSSSSGGNSLTMIQVTTTAPAGNASDTGDEFDVTEDGQSNGQTNTDDDEEPVVSETPADGQQTDSTTPSTTTPAAPAPAPAGGMPPVPALTGAAAAPEPFILQQAGANRTILIGCALPFEGNQRVVGEAVFQAAVMAIKEKAPTLLPGVNINFTCINSKCVDIPTYNAVYDLAEQGAVAVLGEVCSGASVAAAGVSNAKKLPIISPSSTSPSLSQPDFFFRVIPSDNFQGGAAADLMVNSGHKNIGLVYEDTPYGYGLGFSLIAAFTSHGGNVPVVVMFKTGQGNIPDTIKQLQAGKANSQYPLDAAFIATSNVSFVADFLVAAEAANLGLDLFAGDSSANPELVTKIGDRPSAINNLTVVAPFPGNPAFLKRFSDFIRQQNADPLAAESVYAARGYDAMTAMMQAYAAAQPPRDGPAIIATLQRQNFTGVSGKVAFDKNGDLVATDETYVFGKHTPKGGIMVENFIDTTNDGVKVGATATATAASTAG